MKNIFISYRRSDSEDIAGRIYDRLAGYFGPSRVFMDVDSLLAGSEYMTQIRNLLNNCDTVIVIIGKKWLTAMGADGQPRLQDPNDVVRAEIRQALIREGTRVLPVLVHRTRRPTRDQLPPDIAAITELDAVDIRSGTAFYSDVSDLIERLEGQLNVLHPNRRVPWEKAIIFIGIVLLLIGVFNFSSINPTGLAFYQISTRMWDFEFAEPAMELGSLKADFYLSILIGAAPAGLGILLIALGKWLCCGQKDLQRQKAHYLTGIGRPPVHKSPRSVLALALGLSSLAWGLLTAIPTLVVAGMALHEVVKSRGWKRGRALIYQGVLYALIGSAFQIFFVRYFMLETQWMEHCQEAFDAIENQRYLAAIAKIEDAQKVLPTGACSYRSAKLWMQVGVLKQTPPSAFIPQAPEVNLAETTANPEPMVKGSEPRTSAVWNGNNEEAWQKAIDACTAGLKLTYESDRALRLYDLRAEAHEKLGHVQEAKEDRSRARPPARRESVFDLNKEPVPIPTPEAAAQPQNAAPAAPAPPPPISKIPRA